MSKTFKAPIIPVIVTYSFDDEMPVWLYGSDEEAEQALWEGFQEELHIEKEENERVEGKDMRVVISDDHRYAMIAILRNDGEDITEWHIGTVYNDR